MHAVRQSGGKEKIILWQGKDNQEAKKRQSGGKENDNQEAKKRQSRNKEKTIIDDKEKNCSVKRRPTAQSVLKFVCMIYICIYYIYLHTHIIYIYIYI